jgi:hypothetical protein|tara:strand:+ start:358 stop:552 length:195 start_codon:yes stop_codon:yes gene_type:complete
MSILDIIRKSPNSKRRWIVKYDSKERIREVKLLYNDHEYRGARKKLTDEDLKTILELNKKNKNE